MLGDFNLTEAQFPFTFRHFGTFAGPQYETGSYDYDTASQEGVWHTLINFDTSFKNLDLGAYLFNSQEDYVGFHCDYVATSMMTLETSYGNIPVFNVFASKTNVNGDINTIGNINSVGNITANGFITHNGSFNLSGVGDLASAINSKLPASSKGFDIPHPNKKNYRLRHICVEGPESGPIYVRGKLDGQTEIKLPDYWKGLIDEESITVTLTPIGSHQELFVKSIDWGKTIHVRNSSGGPIKCYYQVWANRLGENLHVEYKGESPADYPGNSDIYSIAGYDYDRRI